MDSPPRLDAEFEKALSGGVFSGASLLVAVGRAPVLARTWGRTQSKGGDPVTAHTRFDLASLTKPLVTAPLCMIAVARGFLDLDDPLRKFFPLKSIPSEKRSITIRHLLSHASGLPPHRPFYLELVGMAPEVRKNALLSMILETPLQSPRGKDVIYSDLGFLLLGMILENLLGDDLDQLAEKILFEPLGIDELQFCPLDTGGGPELSGASIYKGEGYGRGASGAVFPKGEGMACGGMSFAATQVCPWRKRLLIGEVDDENAWSLGGVAGHAGLLGTARGVFSLLSHLWSIYDGEHGHPSFGGKQEHPPFVKGGRGDFFLPGDLVRHFWLKTGVPENSTWALSYDTPSITNSSAGRYFSPNSIGHLGFTGVSFWLDLERRVLIILLTNRTHPTRQNDAIRQFRPLVHDIIMEEIDYGT